MKKILLILLSFITLGIYAQESIYDFTVKNLNDGDVAMSDYKGKVLLIVNTATKCGFTPQYKELQALYEKYQALGLEILDFPCNQFGQQAPGSNAEIHEFCTGTYNTTFPQFGKIDVNGGNEAPIYTFLKSKQGFKGFDPDNETSKFMDQMLTRQDADYKNKADIKWNFTKFLVNKKGEVIARFEPMDSMARVESVIRRNL